MATWIELDGVYYNKDGVDKIGVYDPDQTYLSGTMRDGQDFKVGPFSSSTAASTALAAIIASDTVIGPYSQ